MGAKKPTDHSQQMSPVRVAPLGELTAYTVHGHELDTIAAGSQATLAFNVAVALISIGITFILTLTTTTIASDRLFYGYLTACINCWIIGLIALIYWIKIRTSVHLTVTRIKSRLVVSQPIQQELPVDPTAGQEVPAT